VERCKYFYTLNPIDWFAGFLSVAEYIRQIEDEYEECGANPRENVRAIDCFAKWLVETTAKLKGEGCWEGDIRDKLYVFALPSGESGDKEPLALIVKQDNNGTTFIASPYELKWLKRVQLEVVL